MKNTPAKLTILCILLLGFILFAGSSTAAESPPEEMTIKLLADLYEPVDFNHQMHAENYECSRCHHDSDADNQIGTCNTCHSGRPLGKQKTCSACHSTDIYEPPESSAVHRKQQYHIDTLALKGAWHQLCRNCHLEDGGPTECQDCHAFTEKGREFFKIKK